MDLVGSILFLSKNGKPGETKTRQKQCFIHQQKSFWKEVDV
jgi:hypothetical protein